MIHETLCDFIFRFMYRYITPTQKAEISLVVNDLTIHFIVIDFPIMT